MAPPRCRSHTPRLLLLLLLVTGYYDQRHGPWLSLVILGTAMDQQAFRQLLSTPRHGDSSDARSSSASARLFGKQQKRSGTASQAGPADGDQPNVLLPRGLSGTREHGERTSGQRQQPRSKSGMPADPYVDRAEARRLGREDVNEFKDVERLRDDFERRMGEAQDDDERRQLSEQMAFLGGDAKHSILVKGLDFALLEQQKAKLEGVADPDRDDDLEAAFRGKQAKEAAQSNAGKGQESSSLKTGKFKPIGQKAHAKIIGKSQAEDSPEYIWRDGKRMRKKKKKDQLHGADQELKAKKASSTVSSTSRTPVTIPKNVSDNGHHQGVTVKDRITGRSAENQREESVVRQSSETAQKADQADEHKRSPVLFKDKRTEETPLRAEGSEEEEDDIFAGAGRWDGIVDEESDDDGNEEEDERKEESQGSVEGKEANRKRDWFALGSPATDAQPPQEALPAGLNEIIAHAKDAQEGANVRHAQGQQSADDDAAGSAKQASPPSVVRLTGLSDSTLQSDEIRYLLDQESKKSQRDSANGSEKGAKRKRKRKGKGAGGDEWE